MDGIGSHGPRRIAFVGKNAVTWFYRFSEKKEITHSQASGHKRDRRSLNIGPLDWSYHGLDYHLLTNTHRQWDRDVWLDFYKKSVGMSRPSDSP